MRGTRTPPEKIEAIKALSLVYSPQAISDKEGVSLRTVYKYLAKKDNPVIEAKREEMRVDVVERMWKDKDKEIMQLKGKLDMLMDGVNQEKTEKARLMEVTTAYGILFDKRQLLMGKPTENVFSLTAMLERNEAYLCGKSKQDDNNAQGQEQT